MKEEKQADTFESPGHSWCGPVGISKVTARAGFAMTFASQRGAWRCSVQLRQETLCFPLMFTSI